MSTTIFTGTTGDDVEAAKKFWKAIDPVPNVCSSLEDQDISQTFNTKPKLKANVHYAHVLPPEDEVLTAFLNSGRRKEEKETIAASKEVLRRRKKALDRLHEKIRERQNLEEQSFGSLNEIKPETRVESDAEDIADTEAALTMNEIRYFEEVHDLIEDFSAELSDF